MDLTTTYRQDYVWPDCKSIETQTHHGKKKGHHAPEDGEVIVKCTNEKCQCILSERHRAESHPMEESTLQEEDWSRIGPMGPLIDPKLFPAKRPNLGEATLETHATTDKDRLKSTYQKDFTEAAIYQQPPIMKSVQAEYASPRSTANICHPPIRVFDRSCTKNFVPKVIDESMYKLEGGSGGEPAISPYGRTEYQEFISRLGGRIMAEKLIKPIKKKKFW